MPCSSAADLFDDPTFVGFFIVILCIGATLIGVAIFLCVKYRKIKTAYDELRNDEMMITDSMGKGHGPNSSR